MRGGVVDCSPDDLARGEVAVAFVVRRTGSAITAPELRTWCKEQLAPYKVPREIAFVAELPKSAMLKILRRELRAQERASEAQPA